MNRAAQLIPLSSGDLQPVPGAIAQIGAVGPPTRRAYIASGNNLIVFDDDRPVQPAHTGAAGQYGFRNVQIIVGFRCV